VAAFEVVSNEFSLSGLVSDAISDFVNDSVSDA
jgi:hypothetical protein